VAARLALCVQLLLALLMVCARGADARFAATSGSPGSQLAASPAEAPAAALAVSTRGGGSGSSGAAPAAPVGYTLVLPPATTTQPMAASRVAAYVAAAFILLPLGVAGSMLRARANRMASAQPRGNGGLATHAAIEMGASNAKLSYGERMRLLKDAQLADHQYHTMPPVPPPAPSLRPVGIIESSSL
jgi:hypothetical protein